MRLRLALAALLLVALACPALAGCGGEHALTAPLDSADDLAVKAGLLAIQTGIDASYATNGSYPASVNQQTLGAIVSPWPANPFTKAPMAPGGSPGDYIYTVDGGGYHLAGYLSDGTRYSQH